MNRVVLTGGSSGIGKEINIYLLEKGYDVLFTYCHSEASAKEIEARFANAKAFQVDLTSAEQLEAFLAEIETFDPDILINNYYNGTFIDTYFHKTDADKFLNDFKNNVMPALQVTQKCINVFRKKKYGRIINILSSSLNSPAMGTSAYNSNKAYLLQMSKSWAVENVKFGITCNSISPSFIPTDFHKNMDERMKETILSGYPLKDKLESRDVSNMIDLCINGGKHFNGNHLFLDASHY
ncbi:NAD(P)-dependent dehydrogenase (short-subunit alcohol dehydrogenase family) [Chryseobacterium defluvii]|uniref:NAD(P)-dependent dehydrogenase (Short-subunit alcohol dehydrogenase family) n=1 Tax=Chryseobacterium defluvii TaxID=160396 RepID=A0A840KF26_9FLAO|nr:SDR family oxidoreductase [Chryseobacterium defluvii]MBB4806618.1 NAD(P)-dependent dehydrogenase (short-subunit alcohol dehydrogenase family) [Chryseobacterium defluvii]